MTARPITPTMRACGCIEVPLSRGAVTLIDEADADLILPYKWHRSSGGYAARSVHFGPRTTGTTKRAMIYLHRVITDAPRGLVVDHLNRDQLDNRRANLKVMTLTQNKWNARTRGASAFHGVCVGSSQRYPWIAQITVNNKRQHLGSFQTEIEAARAYDVACREIRGEYASLNFPDAESAA